jgi:methylenetetrahydrofolate reductase (NADPH)
MKIKDILKQQDKGVSFEFFPPKTEAGKKSLSTTVEVLKAYKPLYVSMTYGAGGGTQVKTKEAVDMLLEDKEFVVMPHLTCIGVGGDGLRGLLDEYSQKGVENIMALRGDPPQDVSGFDFKDQELCYAYDLVRFIKKDYGSLCVGVAVYPEGHIETDSLDQDLEYTKQKINAGADFAVTQMFFDNDYYYSFLDRARAAGISIPILPGILPLTDIAKVKQFVSVCRTTIPKRIEDEMAKFKDSPEDMEKRGIEFTVEQCRDLIKNGAKKLHFFTLNKPRVMTAILDAI